MQLVLSWPIRILVLGLLVLSLIVDGAGYIYRVQNHYPLTGDVPGLPPNVFGWTLYVHRGLDIQGGTHLELQIVDVPKSIPMSQAQTETIAVINKRVNALGVSEPYVAAEGNDRIVVELAGVPAAKAQDVIGRTAHLVTTTWVADPNTANTFQNPGQAIYQGFKPKISALTGDMVTSATAATDAQTGTQWVVNISFNSDGQNIFGKLTTDAVNACSSGDCAQRHIAEWLDLTQYDIDHWDDPGYAQQISQLTSVPGGKLLTNPYIQSEIPGGTATISGSFTQASATDLATLLNSGALPGSLTILSSSDVGASLGAQSIKASLAAGGLGLAIVVLFMIVYYRLPGFLASLALLCYAGIVLAAFKAIPVTLTLAGMAGFVLSVGMAVDANVLIFERFKEEMRGGRTVGAAVDAAVRRAWPAIRDSNSSTLITSLILMAAGTGPVKGFAVTLFLGVLASLISSIIITHNLLAIVLNFGFARANSVLGVARG